MKTPPKHIQKILNELKQTHEHHLEARLIGKTYYVSESTTKWDKVRKKVINVKTYLGRVKSDGLFIEAKHRKNSNSYENLLTEETGRTAKLAPFEKEDLTILECLSMNSRISLNDLSKITKLPHSTIYNKLKRLEELYGIRYTLDIDFEKLGYMRYMAFVKFEDERPNINLIKEALDIPEILLVLLTKGDYDLIIYILAENNIEASELIYRIRKETELCKYKSMWYLFPIEETYGFVPVRDRFFKLIEKKTTTKLKWRTRDYKKEITKSALAVLKDLSNNSKKEFIEVDHENNLREGATDYEYYKLKKDRIIKNATIILKPKIRYNIAIIVGIRDNVEFRKTQEKLLLDIIEDGAGGVNKYTLVEDMNMPDGGLFVAPIFDEGESERVVDTLKNKVGGVVVNTLMITEVVLGNLPFRRFDNSYSQQAGALTRLFAHTPLEKRNYEGKLENQKRRLGIRGEHLDSNT